MKAFGVLRVIASIGLIAFGMGIVAPASLPPALLIVTLAILIAPWSSEGAHHSKRDIRPTEG